MEDKFKLLSIFISLALMSGVALAKESVQFEKIIYDAKFAIKDSSMHFRLGTLSNASAPGKSRIIAMISETHGKNTEICERMVPKKADRDPNVISMTCKGRLFGSAPILAKLYIANSLPQPLLRLFTGADKADDFPLNAMR